METPEIIDAGSYEQPPQGEAKLLRDLFNLIQKSLGEGHENDMLNRVLQDSALFQIYLAKYGELRDNGKILVNGNDTPCRLSEEIAIIRLQRKLHKRMMANRLLTPTQRELFTDSHTLSMTIEVIEAISKLPDEIITAIGRETLFLIQDSNYIKSLAELPSDLIPRINPTMLYRMLIQSTDIEYIKSIAQLPDYIRNAIDNYLIHITNNDIILKLRYLFDSDNKLLPGLDLDQITWDSTLEDFYQSVNTQLSQPELTFRF